MTTLVVAQDRSAGPLWMRLAASLWVWSLLALALVWLRALGSGDVTAVMTSYGDTDDATRLVQVRTFMAGAGWYDLLLERFGGATPLVSHWSRLVDVPLALLLGAFGLLLSPQSAEICLRLVWPALLLLVLFHTLAREARHHAGAPAAMIALALSATMLTGLFRFLPGRIDHHNLMILLTIAGLLLGLRALSAHKLGYGAGALLGLALTIGYEPIALIVPVMAAATIWGTIDTRVLRPIRNVAIGLAVCLSLGLSISLAPNDWLKPVCDAIASNVALASLIGAATLIAIDRDVKRHMATRMMWLAMGGAAALGSFALLSPQCLAGPFAGLSDAAKRIWLDNVLETYAVDRVWTLAPDSATLMIATIAVALLAATRLARSEPGPLSYAILGLTIMSAIPTLLAYKLYPYMSFIAAFVVALAIAKLPGTSSMPARTQRLAATFAVNQATLAVVVVPAVILAAGLMAPKAAKPVSAAERQAALDTKGCFDFDAIRPLNRLPRGLIVARADLGPFIVASTSHDVVAAPYHRIDGAIVLAHEIMSADTERAKAMLLKVGADYVTTCAEDISTADKSSLIFSLTGGKTPPGLEQVVLTEPTPLRVWRVVR